MRADSTFMRCQSSTGTPRTAMRRVLVDMVTTLPAGGGWRKMGEPSTCGPESRRPAR